MDVMTFKEWHSECDCGWTGKILGWSNNLPLPCPTCGKPTRLVYHASQTVMIATDDFPGGYDVRHGVCHEDGTPRKFYSKTELKRALNEAGYTIVGDTPKPYNVHWSGRKKSLGDKN